MKKTNKDFSKEYAHLLKKHNISLTSITEINNLIKGSIEAAFKVEMNEHLGFEKHQINGTNNERNGYSKKTVKGSFGKITINIPRDRNSNFEPRIIKKHQKDISKIEQKIIKLYEMKTSTKDVVSSIKDIYEFDLDPMLINKVTDKFLQKIEKFRTRPLDKMYSMIFIDQIKFKTGENNKSTYIVMGYTMDGYKEILDFYIGELKSSKYWLKVFNNLKTRGIENVLIISSDNLPGISSAIKTSFPKAIIQNVQFISKLNTSNKHRANN